MSLGVPTTLIPSKVILNHKNQPLAPFCDTKKAPKIFLTYMYGVQFPLPIAPCNMVVHCKMPMPTLYPLVHCNTTWWWWWGGGNGLLHLLVHRQTEG